MNMSNAENAHKEVLKMEETCGFCAKIKSGFPQAEIQPWDRLLYESKNFIVLPTVGAIVQGWLLIVPKDHYLCMGALDRNLFAEYEELCATVADVIERCYGPVAIFEHGPAKPNEVVGCSVDHAHVHLVPTQCDLILDASKMFTEPLEWRSASGIADTRSFFIEKKSYLYLEQPLGKAFIANHPGIQSQLFRKVIAAHAGCLERYDWRSFPEINNILFTVNEIGPLLRNIKARIQTRVA